MCTSLEQIAARDLVNLLLADAPPLKSTTELAHDAVAYTNGDFLFDGSMEGDFDKAFPVYADFAKAVQETGTVDKSPTPHLRHPLIIKTHLIAENPKLAQERIGKQLNLGVSGIVFVGVESADEVKAGLAVAMRFKFGQRAACVLTMSATRQHFGE